MLLNFTEKERGLLRDQKSHEELCVEKYTNYSNEANDPQLKQLLYNHAMMEQQHLNSINKLLNGELPNLNAQNNNNNNGNNNSVNTNTNITKAGMKQVEDSEICKDMLMTEKYVSSGYDTAIFEFKDTNVRDVLNHIQKEEQKHGEEIYKYMEQKGYYNA